MRPSGRLAPLVLPRRYGIRLPAIDEVPKAMRETVEEFRSTARGGFVLQLIEVDRPEVIRDA
jgi:hypothetical protein